MALRLENFPPDPKAQLGCELPAYACLDKKPLGGFVTAEFFEDPQVVNTVEICQQEGEQ